MSRQKQTRPRAKVAALIHASPGEIIFTSCGKESDNATIESNPGKKHIIASRVERPAAKTFSTLISSIYYFTTRCKGNPLL
ncbi:hypothetical protein EPICR_50131 [Candidatus Desulfarcum epimagneticum]|uniref:Aminotransferase class V domain-containing protein n=1 Tax=uncultured Desulfobacteraceae bacterium TaxID=218296 RepID=A0A484HPS1_9BACT|nr:hypothetical protein EPICR_50131 [uncultured Desulfobacteraceae bacterium]